MQQRKVWKTKEQSQSYAHVVEQELERSELGGKAEKVISFIVKEECTKWFEGCYVGRMLEVGKVQAMKESFILEGFNFIRVRYLEEKFVLLSGELKCIVKRTYEENKVVSCDFRIGGTMAKQFRNGGKLALVHYR